MTYLTNYELEAEVRAMDEFYNSMLLDFPHDELVDENDGWFSTCTSVEYRNRVYYIEMEFTFENGWNCKVSDGVFEIEFWNVYKHSERRYVLFQDKNEAGVQVTRELGELIVKTIKKTSEENFNGTF